MAKKKKSQQASHVEPAAGSIHGQATGSSIIPRQTRSAVASAQNPEAMILEDASPQPVLPLHTPTQSGANLSAPAVGPATHTDSQASQQSTSLPEQSTTRALWCLILGDSTPFDVFVHDRDNIGHLKRLIKEEGKNGVLSSVDAKDLTLWKILADQPISAKPSGTLPKRVRDLGQDRAAFASELDPVDTVSEAFGAQPNKDHLHIIVQVPSFAHIAAIAAPEMVTVNCWVLSDNPNQNFSVKIDKTESVCELKKLIKKEKQHAFRHVDADALVLWQVAISPDGREAVLENCKDPSTIGGAKKPEATALVSEIFPEPAIKDIHIIVKAPESSTRDKGDEITRDSIGSLSKRYENVVQNILKADPPSKSATSSRYLKSQIAYSIYDGRYKAKKPITSTALPVQLYHPVFHEFFTTIASKSTLDDDFIRRTSDYMKKASAVYVDETQRGEVLNPHLCNILGFNIRPVQNPDKTCADGIVEGTESIGPYLFLLQEDKKEIGDGQSDPSTQGGLSAARYWAQTRYEAVRNVTCCPTFVIATAGPWLTVLGVVFIDGVIVQRLTDFVWVGIDSVMNESQVSKVATIFYALGKSLQKLDEFYKGLPNNPSLKPRYFPWTMSYPDDEASNGRVDFVYEGYLENGPDCVTLHAMTCSEPPVHIVVKYVDRYGERAHRLLADRGLAPKLYYHGPVVEDDGKYGVISMVVMEYIEGDTLFIAKRQMDLQRKGEMKKTVEDAVGILHNAGLVFGDLRDPNVMVTKDGKVKLVDFNWAGEEGQVRYPSCLAPLVEWPEGIRGHDLI